MIDLQEKEKKAESEKKMVTVFIDSRAHEVEKNQVLTYEEIVRMWQGHYEVDEGVNYMVTFSHGHSEHSEDELLPGEWVKAKEGMVINVGRTNRS